MKEMKRSKKIILGLLIMLSVCGCGKKEKMDKPNDTNQPQNIEETTKPGEEKQERQSTGTLQDFKIVLLASNLEEETSEYTFEITNIAREKKYINAIEVKAKDSEGNNVITLTGVLEEEIESGEKTEVTCSYGGKLEGITTFEYEIK